MQFRAFLVALAGVSFVTGSSSAAPLRYGSYYDESAEVDCTSASICQLFLGQTPTDKLVMFRKVNCSITSSSPVISGHLGITKSNGDVIPRFIPLPVPSPVAGTTYQTNFESDIHWLVGQGRFPFIDFFTLVAANRFYFACTITGDLVDPIQ